MGLNFFVLLSLVFLCAETGLSAVEGGHGTMNSEFGSLSRTKSGILIPNGACEDSLRAFDQSVTNFQVYSSEDVIKALSEEGVRGNSPNFALLRIYEKMQNLGEIRYLLGPPELENFEKLLETAPNHKLVIESLVRRAKLARDSGEPMSLEPILLLGPPGVGKTHFAKTLAKIIGTQYRLLPMSSLTAGWILSGIAPQWKDAQAGYVAKGLIEGQYANPIYVVDEIDKASGSKERDPLGAFYSLLERDTAKEFEDEYIGIKIDTSRVLWIATANNIEDIPEPILNRMTVFEIDTPTQEENIKIINSLYSDILSEHPTWKFNPELSESVQEKMSLYPPRDSRRILMEAIAKANFDNRKQLIPEDLDDGKLTTRKQRIGF